MFAVDMDFFAGAPLPSFLSEAAWTEVELPCTDMIPAPLNVKAVFILGS